MRRFAAALALAVLTTLLYVVTDALPAGPAQAGTVTLDGVRVRLQPGSRQVVTVNHTRGYHARVVLWRRTSHGWERAMEAAGRIGYGGLVRGDEREQGSGTTPLGTYRLLWTFGTQERRPAWSMAHRRIRSGDYWVMDNRSRYYNRWRNRSDGGFRWWLPASDMNGSERLTDYLRQYEFSVVTSFNYAEQVRYRGAGIFLHVHGDGATAGCISAPRWFLVGLMRRLDPSLRPLVAIGR